MESSRNAQDIAETLIKLRELTDLAKKSIQLDRLQIAISSLQDALGKGKYNEDKRLILQYYLAQTLLTRFGLYKWIDDLDECFQYFGDVESLIESSGQDGHEEIIEVKLATQAIQECRRSLNIDKLNTLTQIADATASSYANDGFTPGPQMFDLLIELGNAYLLKYMKLDLVTELDHAATTFQEAERLCAGHVSYSYISLTSLAHIEWLRLTECGEKTAFSRFCNYLIAAGSVDEEGTGLFNNGVEMVESAADESQLQEAVTLLFTALQHRIEPHPRRAWSLHSLARALLTRFERRGNMRDLEDGITLNEESVRLRPKNHPERALSLNILAAAYLLRYQRIGRHQDLQASIILNRECLHLWPPHHPNRPSLLSNLAAALLKQFSQEGSNEGLSEAISLLRESVSNHTRYHPDRSMSLNNLASALQLHQAALDSARNLRPVPHPEYIRTLDHLAVAYNSRFKHKGDIPDLEKCISLHREALDMRPSPSPYRSSSLSNLASALLTRFSQKARFQDLEEAIVLHREALVLQPIPHPHRSMTLNNLASALSTRFRQNGDLQDLDQCLVLHREALDLRSTSHPHRSMSLENLGLALITSFEQRGTLQDLEESIGLLQEALVLQPSPHPSRPASLGKLAGSLFIRFRHKGTFQDLESCIVFLREELSLRANPHPDRPSSLNNLAAALVTRFEQREGFHDLEESIQLYHEALDSWPAPHPHRSMSLTNLANALCTRFAHKGIAEDLGQSVILYREALDLRPRSHPEIKRTQNLQDLEECISVYREALDLQPAPHPHRSVWLKNLAHALSTRVDHKHRESQHEEYDMEEVLCCYEEASKYETGSIVNRFNSTQAWANCAKAHRSHSALDAYQYGIELLPLLASLDLTLKQRQDVLEHCREFVSNAAKCAIDSDRCDLAVTFLTIGRSIFWSQALQLRTPADELKVTHPALAERFITISGRLERASYSGPGLAPDLMDAKHPSTGTKFTSFHALVDERLKIIEEIRKIPGFENFLRPHSFSSLQAAAENGPVILLNASDFGCDALIMRHTGPVVHIPLSDIHLDELESLKANVHALSDVELRANASKEVVEEVQLFQGRDMFHSSAPSDEEEPLRLVLECLWFKVVYPALTALHLEKTTSPVRIWWCPTGPFSSLPIHAAGVYSVENDPIDCLFEYSVSSYCTSPQDLLHHQPPIDQGFKMTAVIEPEAPGAAVLPATRAELTRINDHIPNQKNLITHTGSRGTSTQVDKLLSDIQRSSFVHFGCHGTQNLNNALESYLLLSGGKLTMSRIIQECQVPEGALAYLSACETAKGDEARPDESLNLVATMMFAGFRSVVGTMWSIFDEDAPVVADVFYSYLFRNGANASPNVKDTAYGLHLATATLREQGKPFYSWVPYVHYGI